MFSYLNPWQSQLVFPAHHHHHPYAPAPPPVAHKVWILDCKSCGTFLTNRGMKAVLLLRPNVALYSSDALPVNCSAYTSNPQALKPPTACPSSSTHPLRTCECLTQTLCCHGCGSAIGYMIVIPCARCTSSISATNRATNGHRFVFHSSEIKGTERHYIPDEPGVIMNEATATPPAGPAARPDYLPTPPLDIDDESPTSSNMPSPSAPSFPFPQENSHLAMDSPLPHYPVIHSDLHAHYPHLNHIHASRPSHNRATSAASSESSNSSPPPLIPPSPLVPAFGLPADHFEAPLIPPLQAGDVLYWHHLVRHGEIPGVMEDARARRRSLAINVGKTRVHFDR
ncbi:hypothetical protein MVEN_00524300 [Mycena venus]|uniref:Protein FAM72A n=1 Tax=Mycena venus TaxID=2733690 RepID=A0A8H6YN95_9AGAR|nr:hypothetical protein MVEN_00524300 [Mycena venus]